MTDIFLSRDEKASLTDFAKKLISRSQRSLGAKPQEDNVATGDQLSVEGLSRRITAVERQIEKDASEWMRNLKATLLSVERLEARTAKLDGELRAIRELVDRIEFMSAAQRDELFESAQKFATTTATDLSAVIIRLNAMLQRGFGPKGDEIARERSE